jgi:hypothetical protein
MGFLSYFSESYQEARKKFLAVCSDACARIESYKNPERGPAGIELYTDVARFGPEDASKVLFLCSGVHGPEGYAGSACQTGWIDTGKHQDLPDDLAVVLIHAANPYGFAWNTRNNEDNVNLNRNFLDFPIEPKNPEYALLHPFFVPDVWDETSAEMALKALKIAKELDPRSAAVQSVCRDGLEYTGDAPVWSNRTMRRIIDVHAGTTSHVALIDYHTGPEPYGHSYYLCHKPEDSQLGGRVRDWYGEIVHYRSPELVEFNAGQFYENLPSMLPSAEVTPVIIEFCTGKNGDERDVSVLLAQHWYAVNSSLDTPEGQEMMVKYRQEFYPNEDDDWKELVWTRSAMSNRRAIAGLAG